MKAKRKLVVGLATIGILGSLSTSWGVVAYEHNKIITLEKQCDKLQDELKTTKKQNKEYLAETKELADEINEIITLISEKTN